MKTSRPWGEMIAERKGMRSNSTPLPDDSKFNFHLSF